jgi:hypothetical protein
MTRANQKSELVGASGNLSKKSGEGRELKLFYQMLRSFHPPSFEKFVLPLYLLFNRLCWLIDCIN